MNESQAIKLITKYIYDRKGVNVHISIHRIVGDVRQSTLLEEAVKIAVDYYNNKTIII